MDLCLRARIISSEVSLENPAFASDVTDNTVSDNLLNKMVIETTPIVL